MKPPCRSCLRRTVKCCGVVLLAAPRAVIVKKEVWVVHKKKKKKIMQTLRLCELVEQEVSI